MESALLIVVIGVTFVCSLIAIFTLAGTGKTYGQIGSGGMPSSDARETPADRDEEIRQLLEARNARRARRGEELLDVDAELAALSGQVVDEGLRDEVRQLVTARNARRERKGQPPLDVESEVDRQLRDLT
jgi:hypothetical protein